MAGLADLLPYVFEHVTDLPRSMAFRRLREGARLFADETKAFRVIVAVPLVADQQSYDISAQLPTGTEIINIDHVRIGDEDPLEKRTYIQVHERRSQGYGCSNSGGEPKAYYLQTAGAETIYLDVPAPEALQGTMLTARISVRPTLSGDLEDHWVSRYYEGIVAGALMLVYNMPDEEWSNITASQRQAKLFSARAEAARREVELESSNRVVFKSRYNG